MAGTNMRLTKARSISHDWTDQIFAVTPSYATAHADGNITTDYTYVPGINQLDVVVNGVDFTCGLDYTEVDSHTIHLINHTITANDKIHIRNWTNREIRQSAGTALLDLDTLRSEIINARQYGTSNAPYYSLDERLDVIQTGNTKVLVFVIMGGLTVGQQGIEIKCPFPGVITSVVANCSEPPTGGSSVMLQVEKISRSEYLANGAWVDVLDAPITIDDGTKSSEASAFPCSLLHTSVAKDDFFRLNIYDGGIGAQNFTIEVLVNLI